jgi:hypothetical protein
MRGTPILAIAAVALVIAGCGGSKLTGDSTCKDYVQASRDAQEHAIQVVAQDNGGAYSFLVQNNVDARCSVAPDKTIRWAVAGKDDKPSSTATQAAKDDKPSSTATQAAKTTSTQAQPQVRAQANLTPPKGAPVKKAVAIVQFVDVNGQEAINAAIQGLPTSKTIVYGLWFFNGPSQAKFIGRFDQTDNKGHLVLQGQLPKGVDVSSYKDLVITREKPSTNPTSPGAIYLRGSIQNAAGG